MTTTCRSGSNMPKKLTKAEKERLKREEAERKAREEEEQRRIEAEEQRLREEEEAKEREERARLKAIEDARFAEERSRLDGDVERRREELTAWQTRTHEEQQWNHYLSCSKLPLVSDEQALNTFLTLYREQTVAPDQTMSDLLEGIGQCLQFTELIDALSSTVEPSLASVYHEKLSMIHSIVGDKLNTATLDLMRCADKHIDPESFNLKVEASIPQLEFGLWGNIVKDPRLKNFTLSPRSFTMDIPKPLLLADAAVRILCPLYDTLSPQTKSYHYTPPTATPTSIGDSNGGDKGEGGSKGDLDGGEEKEKEKTKNDDTEKGGSGKKRGDLSAPSSARSTSSRKGRDKSGRSKKDSTSKQPPDEDAVSTASGTKEGEGGEGQNGDTGEPVLQDDEVDLREYHPAGGPIIMQLLLLPPQPKTINNWTMSQVMVEGLKELPHPVDPNGVTVPVSISMKFPKKYIFPNAPQLAQWDDQLKSWRTGKLQDVEVTLEDRSVSFKTLQFAPVAFMSELYANLPYMSWNLVPLGENHTRLHIVGAACEMAVEIKMTECWLVQPADEPAVEDLLNKHMGTHALMKAMKSRGLHFFPQEDAEKYASLSDKDREVEREVYDHISMCCSAYAFQLSHWNNESARDQVVVRVCPCSTPEQRKQLQDQTDLELLPWPVILGGKRSCKLSVTEDSEAFSTNPEEGAEAHSSLFFTLEAMSSGHMTTTSPVHANTVTQWLLATRPLAAS